MLVKWEAAFEADLERYYHIDLAAYYRGEITARKLAVCLMYLPRGASLWQCIGGANAITAETESLWLLEHTTTMIAHSKAGGKGKKPEMRPYPKGLEEILEKQDHKVSQAEAFRRKQAARQEAREQAIRDAKKS